MISILSSFLLGGLIGFFYTCFIISVGNNNKYEEGYKEGYEQAIERKQ